MNKPRYWRPPSAQCEPDHDLGLTAACSAPICGRERVIFRRYWLWGAARPKSDLLALAAS